MLIGPGGVVALVMGAWAVMWAVRRVPGLTWRTWYPAVAAFLATILAFAMLTAQSEVGLGLIEWARADPAERLGVVADTASATVRPLLAAGLAAVAFGVAIVASRSPGSPLDERTPHWLERVALVGMAGFALLDGVVWIALKRAFDAAVSDPKVWAASVPRIQMLTLFGALASVGLIGLALLVGVWRSRRS